LQKVPGVDWPERPLVAVGEGLHVGDFKPHVMVAWRTVRTSTGTLPRGAGSEGTGNGVHERLGIG
jgi:hypothetical protein